MSSEVIFNSEALQVFTFQSGTSKGKEIKGSFLEVESLSHRECKFLILRDVIKYPPKRFCYYNAHYQYDCPFPSYLCQH